MSTDAGRPFVTVIMPVRNEAGAIEASLGSLMAQDYPSDRVEILVADGMSTDGTRSLVEALAAQTPSPTVRLLDNPDGIVPSGMNVALREARGEIIVRADGHSEFPSDYVRRCVEGLARTGADNFGGLAAAEGDTPIARAIATAVSSPFGVGNARFRTGGEEGWVDTVPFGTWHRSVFDRIGGFDEELVRNQDDEHNFRLVQSGGRIWLDPSIRITYRSRRTIRSLARQYYEYGLYKVRVMQKRKGVASLRQLVPALFVLALASSVVLSLSTRRARWVGAVVLPYAAGIGAATASSRPSDHGVAVRMPAAFATLHTAYGVGFLAGLWRWRSGFASAAARPSTKDVDGDEERP